MKRILACAVFALTVVGVLALAPAFSSKANAQVSSAELSGYAWSSNIGWISLNCKNTNSCSSANYAVIRNGNSNLSGYAWSSNIGWIIFNTVGPYPQGSGTYNGSSRMDNNQLKGWARAWPDGYGGGWDGWISLSGTTSAGGAYGPTLNSATGKFAGFAWGDDVVGWVDFSGVACAGCSSTTSYSLTAAVSGPGGVTSNPAGISCGPAMPNNDCAENYAAGTTVVLTASPSTAARFTGWSGACSGTDATCRVTMSAAKSISAVFVPTMADTNDLTITISKTNGADGKVEIKRGSTTVKTCTSNCTYSIPSISTENLTLVATQTVGDTFAWAGTWCSGNSRSCTLVLNTDKNVTAGFNNSDGPCSAGCCPGENCGGCPPNCPPGDGNNTLSVDIVGTGSVAIVKSGSTVKTCSTDCTYSIDDDRSEILTLTTTPASGAFSGACSGSGSCTLTLDHDLSVTATFGACTPGTPGCGGPTFEFGACPTVGGRCVMTIDCDAIVDCEDKIVYSNAIPVIPGNTSTVIDYSGLMAGTHSQFSLMACTSATATNTCSPLTGSRSGQFYLRTMKNSNELPAAFSAAVRITGAAGGVSTQKDASFRFINSGGGQN